MTKKLFIGNLPFSVTEVEIQELFGEHGEVQSVNLVVDRMTGRPRGFGFVLMDPEGAQAARQALDGSQFGGRPLRVDEATEQAPRGAPRRVPRGASRGYRNR